MTFSDRIKQAIESDERSRYRLCKLAGIEQAALARFMAGTTGLNTRTLDKLLPVLGLKLDTTRKRKAKPCHGKATKSR